MDVFFDTEFTDINPMEQPFLISIGLVALDGRKFYAELSDTYHIGLCSDFVKQFVLTLLDGSEYRMPEAQLAIRLKEWIEALGDDEVVLRSDSPIHDWPWVAELFQFYGCWPKNMRRKCGAIGFENPNMWHRFNAGLAFFWRDNIARQHHALVDARSLQFAYKFALRRGM